MRVLIVVLVSLLSFSVQGKNYYVSKTGSDTNSGDENTPFLTIEKASSLMTAGDTCFIMSGTYREVITPQNSGSEGSPIVYTNYQSDTVLISATEIVDDWQNHDGSIYKVGYKMELGRQNMVFCNGEAMDWARWPNNSDNDKYTVEGAEVSGGSASTIECADIDNTDWTGAYVWYLGAHSGTSWTRKVTASQSGKITFEEVNINKWPFSSHNPTVWRENEGNHRGQFYVFNKLEALDKEQEWYYDSATETVYFQATGNADPNNLLVEIAERERTIHINQKNYIHIIGLNAFGGKAEIEGANCVIKDCSFKNCLQILDELDNTDAQVGNAPVHVRGSHTVIENNVIDGSSLNGIYIQGWGGVTEVTIKNNLVKNCNTVGIHASPIRSAATHVKILSNTLHTSGRDGIYCGKNDCEIAYNDVYDCMRINNDGGLFYVVGNANDKNNEVHHNWFHDSWGPSYADGRCAGIYLDNDSKGYLVHHNVVWNITWTGIQINWDNWNIDIYNNSIYNALDGAMGRWENNRTIDDIVIKNNYASGGEWIGTDVSTITNLINSNAPFRSVADKDFRPAMGSGLIDGGEIINEITDGFQGAAPDIGAYEDGLSPWIPGVNTVVGGEPDTPVGVGESIINQSEIKVYPNPLLNSNLNVKTEQNSRAVAVKIFNGTGQLVYKNKFSQNNFQIERSKFRSSGIYTLVLEQNGKVSSQKVAVY